MDKLVEKGILYDYYGVLLTDRQRQIYEDAVYNDLSLSELAETYGISRQGVHDLIRRCDHILADYEAKLGCIRRDRKIRSAAVQLADEADGLTPSQIRELALQILSGIDE